MVFAIVLAFLVGVLVGVLLGRRTPPAVDGPKEPKIEISGIGRRRPALPDDAFVPNDDILERLRLASEGKLDPAELDAAPPPEPEPEPEQPPRPEFTEAERRVLDRLRAQQRDNGSSK